MTEERGAALVDDGRKTLTNSRISTFRDCPMKHALMYEDGIRPATDQEALRLGSLFHVGLAAWWNAVKQQDRELTAGNCETVEFAEGQADVAFKAAIAAVMEYPDSDQVVQVKVEEMLRGYHVKWRYDAMRYEVLQVEGAFRAPLVNPDTGSSSRTYDLGGKVDVIVKLRSDSSVGVIEHKSSSEDISSDSKYWLKLAMDPQISMYTIGTERLGLEPAWTLYDVAKKPELKPLRATPAESRKYRQRRTVDEKTWAEDDPRLLYANNRAVDETLEEYRMRVRDDILNAEGGLNRYFARKVVARTESQLYDFLADTWQTGRTISEYSIKGRRPRNPNACHRFGECMFFNHCAYGEPLTDVAEGGKWQRVAYVHPELLEVTK